jgi:hypothetical protein
VIKSFRISTPRDFSPEDKIVLDALIEVGFDRTKLKNLSEEDKQRLDSVEGLMHILEAYPIGQVDAADQRTLVDAALARIDQYEERTRSRMKVGIANAGQDSGRSQRRIRLPDFIALAAVLLIVASITLPILNHMKGQSASTACGDNLAAIGSGFSLFANDNGGTMPNVMQAGIGGGWGQFSNTKNLDPLTHGHYCSDGHFDCPGNHSHSPSYSYQMQQPGQMMQLASGRPIIILADKNPVIEALRENRPVDAMELSRNHRQQGSQNTLWSDGSCRQIWEEPVIEHDGFHDNIWLPQGVGTDSLSPKANPSNDRDVFLAH